MSDFEKIHDDILNSLNNFTRQVDVESEDRFKKIRDCSFFDPVPSEYLAEIANHSRIVHFAAKDKIITELDVIRPFYVLIYGTATAYFDHRAVGHILSGECLGESAFFTKEAPARSAAVVADGEVIALEMGQLDIEAISDATRMFMDKALLLALFKKLQAANRHIPANSMN